MTVTTSYSWTQDGNFHLMNNLFTAGNQFAPQVTANAARTEYFGAWSDGSNGFQAEGRVMASDETPVSDEFTINVANNAGLQFDPDVAGLAGGNFVAVYNDLNADPGGDIRAVLYSPQGRVSTFDFPIDTSAADDSQPRVAALSDGGFAVTWTRFLGNGNFDIHTGVFNADGSPRPGPNINGVLIPNNAIVDGAPGSQTKPDIAGLASGKFVVVWQDDSNHTVYFDLFNSSDLAVAGPRVPIDGTGTVTTDIHVAGLSDGGFAVSFTDNSWGISGTEVTFEIFNANGTARTGFIRANSTALGGIEAGDQDRSTITTLGNGMIVVGWQDENSGVTYSQVFDAAGNPIGTNQAININAIEADFAGLSAAKMAVVLQSTTEDGVGNGNSIRTGVDEFTRTFFVSGGGNTVAGLNDGLREIFNGHGGNDTLIGSTGVDQFFDTGSHNHFTGGAGADVFALDPSAVTDAAATHVFNHITDYDQGNTGIFSAAEGDQIDLSGLLADAFNLGHGQPVAALVRAIASGAGTDLQVDPDGAANGTAWTTVAQLDGVQAGATINVILDSTQPAGTQLTVHPELASNDLNGDGDADVLWQNANGQPGVWLMNGTSAVQATAVGSNPGPAWKVIGSGDFDGDGKWDILWQNDNGQPGVWLMNGTTPGVQTAVGSNPGPSWKVVGTGDFDGDGRSDILWQNTNGQPGVWLMNGTTPVVESAVGTNPGPSWKVIGSGDFDGDGKSDILWQNDNGQAGIWLMNGTTPGVQTAVGSNMGPSWKIVGTGDFNGDGKSDILWQNSDGTPAIWLMNGTTPIAEANVGANPGAAWKITGAADLNGDGKADILWQNSDGTPGVWLMNGLTPTVETAIGPNPGASWQMVHQHHDLF